MRLAILDGGHDFGTKALFALIRTVSRQPVLDVIKLVKYRADFYGSPMQGVTHEAMRGPSTWSVGDRELMAAFVAKTNQCEFCTKAHAAVAQRAYRNGKTISALLSDLDTAAIEEPLRAMLLMLGKLTRDHTVDADDMRAVLAAGASPQLEDALAVCFSFNVIGSVGRCLRVLRAWSQGLRGWREIPPRARLPLSTTVANWHGSFVRSSSRQHSAIGRSAKVINVPPQTIRNLLIHSRYYLRRITLRTLRRAPASESVCMRRLQPRSRGQSCYSCVTGNSEIAKIGNEKRPCRKERFSVDPMGQYSNADSETI
jgi:AhpD family alkylhydroperoxidase